MDTRNFCMILSAIRVNPLPSMLPFLLVILLYTSPPFYVFLLFVFVFLIFFFGFNFFLLFLKCPWPPSPLSHLFSHRLSFASLLAHALCFASLPVSFRLFSFSALILSLFISSIIKIIRFTVPCFGFFLYVDVPKCFDVSIACDGRCLSIAFQRLPTCCRHRLVRKKDEHNKLWKKKMNIVDPHMHIMSIITAVSYAYIVDNQSCHA